MARGAPEDSVTLVRRAALAHDLGRVGVPNGIWEKPGPLGFGEWERVRLHAHYTERAFAQSPALAPIGRLAGSHHERLDGSGYHRGSRGPDLDQNARILAAADCYSRDARGRAPTRPALDRRGGGRAAARGEGGTARPRRGRRRARRGRAPRRQATARAARRADARELEVLLALVRGESNQAIGDGLGISVKTAGHHVQHIYEKAGVRSRAAATLWAFEQDLVQSA